MEIGEIRDSVNKYIGDRLQNPFFASVIAVWLMYNKVLVFGIFNFDSEMRLAQKIHWVAEQFDKFDFDIIVVVIPGFYTIAFKSLIVGYVVMIGMSWINVSGKIVYKWITKTTRSVLQKIEESKWKSIDEFEEYVRKTNSLETKATELEERLFNLQSKHDEIEKELASANETIQTKNQEVSELKSKLSIKISEDKRKPDLSEIFDGEWTNYYVHPNGNKGKDDPVSVFENTYMIGGKHTFDLDMITISKDNKQIGFRKVDRKGDRIAVNYLTVINDEQISGLEVNPRTNDINTVNYVRRLK